MSWILRKENPSIVDVSIKFVVTYSFLRLYLFEQFYYDRTLVKVTKRHSSVRIILKTFGSVSVFLRSTIELVYSPGIPPTYAKIHSMKSWWP